jgi:HK97 gp10 family phage protein
MKVSVKFDGGAQLAAGLERLSRGVSKRVTLNALRAGGEPIRKQISVNAPFDPTTPLDIRDNIVMAPVKNQKEQTVAVGPRKGFAYGLPNEIGTARQPARPFVRPAFDTHVEKALGEINLSLRRDLIQRDVLTSGRATAQGSSESFADDDTPPVSGGPGGGLL